MKNQENSNEALHQNHNPSQNEFSNVSFNNEANETSDFNNLNNNFNNSNFNNYQNRDNITHKLKDSNLNNPFSKNYKPSQTQNINYVNNFNNQNLTSNSNAINDFTNFNSNQFQSNIYNNNNNSKLRSGVANKIMRVIKGGNGSKPENSQNHFFSKMLNNNEKTVNNLFTSFDPSIRNSFKNTNNSKAYKININKLQREKFEQELRMLDCDDLNNSGDSEFKQGSNTNRELESNVNNFDKNNFVSNNNRNNNNKLYASVNIDSSKNYEKSYKYDDNPISNRVKTPDRHNRGSIWNIFS